MPDDKKPLAKHFKQIKPHGGRLIDRMVTGEKRETLIARVKGLTSLQLNARELADLEMLAVGAMSPLEGFMTRRTYDSVLESMHLPQGLPWTIPVTLSVKPGEDASQYKEGLDIALRDGETVLGVMHLEQKWQPDKKREAEKVLLTNDEAHPGVKYLQTIGDTYLGGEVSVFQKPAHADFANYRLDPKETRVLFKAKGWSTITAFQTRNPIHRAHEYLQKCALEIVDGLLIHPLVGETKKDDIPADVRMALLRGPHRRTTTRRTASRSRSSRRPCATPARARPSSTPSSARTTAARTSSSAATTRASATTTAPTTRTTSSTSSTARRST